MNSSTRVAGIYPYLILLAILLMAAGFRLTAIQDTQVHRPVRADAAHYVAYAYNLRNAGVYSLVFNEPHPEPDAVRSPGYPLFLLPFSKQMLTQQSVFNITLTQALLGCLTVLLCFFLCRRFMSTGYALAATFLTANSPHLISADTYLLTESLFTFLCVCFLWVGSYCKDQLNIRLFALTGILLGLAALTRPSMQYFIIFFAVLGCINYGWKRGTKLTLLVTIFFVLVYSPWIIRNYISLGKPSDSTLSIAFLHHGMYPDFTYGDNEKSYGFPYRFDPRSEVISTSTTSILQEIRSRFIQEPKRHLQWFLLGKPKALWSWDIVNGAGDIFIYPVEKSPYLSNRWFEVQHLIMWMLHWPLVIIGLFATIVVWLPRRFLQIGKNQLFAARLVSTLVIYFMAIHIVGAPFPRYSIPLRPMIYALGMFGISFLAYRFSVGMADRAQADGHAQLS